MPYLRLSEVAPLKVDRLNNKNLLTVKGCTPKRGIDGACGLGYQLAGYSEISGLTMVEAKVLVNGSPLA